MTKMPVYKWQIVRCAHTNISKSPNSDPRIRIPNFILSDTPNSAELNYFQWRAWQIRRHQFDVQWFDCSKKKKLCLCIIFVHYLKTHNWICWNGKKYLRRILFSQMPCDIFVSCIWHLLASVCSVKMLKGQFHCILYQDQSVIADIYRSQHIVVDDWNADIGAANKLNEWQISGEIGELHEGLNA